MIEQFYTHTNSKNKFKAACFIALYYLIKHGYCPELLRSFIQILFKDHSRKENLKEKLFELYEKNKAGWGFSFYSYDLESYFDDKAYEEYIDNNYPDYSTLSLEEREIIDETYENWFASYTEVDVSDIEDFLTG